MPTKTGSQYYDASFNFSYSKKTTQLNYYRNFPACCSFDSSRCVTQTRRFHQDCQSVFPVTVSTDQFGFSILHRSFSKSRVLPGSSRRSPQQYRSKEVVVRKLNSSGDQSRPKKYRHSALVIKLIIGSHLKFVFRDFCVLGSSCNSCWECWNHPDCRIFVMQDYISTWISVHAEQEAY